MVFNNLREKIKISLKKTHQSLTDGMNQLFHLKGEIDPLFLEELEECLISADFGVDTSHNFIKEIENKFDKREIKNSFQIKELLKQNIIKALSGTDFELNTNAHPSVLMILGVNGSGKTTTVGKLAHFYKQQDKEVLIAAADTFRAAAIDQLEIWGQRAGVDVIKQKTGAVPSAVAFDSVQAAIARGIDILILDTAGRLHTRKNLMEELIKIKKVISKQIEGAPHEVLMVLDAVTGQNGISQAKLFHEAMGLTGIILTKLDGTAKGGIIVSIYKELNIPVKLVGTGEGIEDISFFNPIEYASAIFEE